MMVACWWYGKIWERVREGVELLQGRDRNAFKCQCRGRMRVLAAVLSPAWLMRPFPPSPS